MKQQNVRKVTDLLAACQPCTMDSIAEEIAEQGDGDPIAEAILAVAFLLENNVIGLDDDVQVFSDASFWLIDSPEDADLTVTELLVSLIKEGKGA